MVKEAKHIFFVTGTPSILRLKSRLQIYVSREIRNSIVHAFHGTDVSASPIPDGASPIPDKLDIEIMSSMSSYVKYVKIDVKYVKIDVK